MGGCQGRLLPSSSTDIPQDYRDSQSTIVGDEPRDRQYETDGMNGKKSGPDQYEDKLLVPFGKALREKHFSFDPDYHNLNHASYGAIPHAIQSKLHHYQSLHERRPDHFIRYTYPTLLNSNRAAAASLLNAPLDDLVFVPNATTGINTVLRGLPPSFWSADGNDEILYFGTIYGACGKTVAYIQDSTQGRVRGRSIELTYPISDAAIVRKFRDAVATARQAKEGGKRPRLAIFDTVSSVPGVRFPFEQLVATCRELGILSLVDGAQGIGMLTLDLRALDPDFFVSNCHKWLLVPRACAVFYVPRRNHHLVRSTLPTSHSYVPEDSAGVLDSSSKLSLGDVNDEDQEKERTRPGSGESSSPPASSFAEMFAYVGTLDNSPYLCVKDAIEWREKVLGGEHRIREYCVGLARDGGEKVADILGTSVMQNEEGTLMDCFMANVALPLVVTPPGKTKSVTGKNDRSSRENVNENSLQGQQILIPYKDAQRIWEWMTEVLVDEYQTFIPLFYHAGRFWARLSAQVYLDIDDFEWAGETLKDLSDRVARKEYELMATVKVDK